MAEGSAPAGARARASLEGSGGCAGDRRRSERGERVPVRQGTVSHGRYMRASSLRCSQRVCALIRQRFAADDLVHVCFVLACRWLKVIDLGLPALPPLLSGRSA